VALPVPAWAADDLRPGALRMPQLTLDDKKIVRQASAKRALNDLFTLSEKIGPRIGGTDSERRAAAFIARPLARMGYDTTLQPFPVADKSLADLSSPTRLPWDLCWQAGASAHGALDTKVRGQVIDVGAGAPENYPANSTGRI